MDLSKYIQEAISSGKHSAYGVRFPDNPTDKNVKEWLDYKGYPDLTKWEHPTQYTLQKKFIGFYESYMNSSSMFIGIVNGDGMKEYRLYFLKQSGNWNMVSITLVEIKGGKLNFREIEMDDQNMDDLKDWLNNGSGVREAISSGTFKPIPGNILLNDKRKISDFKEYLEQRGFKKVTAYSITEVIKKHGSKHCYAILGNGACDTVVVNIPGKDTAVVDAYDIFGNSMRVCGEYRLIHGTLKMADTTIENIIEYIENA